MKNYHSNLLLLAAFIMLLGSSCGLGVHYLGESFPPKDEVEVYYSERDVKDEYKTIGHVMSAEFSLRSMVEQRQKDMIDEAKRRGADAIIFAPFETTADQGDDDLRLKAQLIQYTSN